MTVSRSLFWCCILAGVASVSCASLFIRLAQAASMPVLAIAAWRLVVACAVLVPYAGVTQVRRIRTMTKGEVGWLSAAGSCLGLHFVTWIGSLHYTSVASSVVLVSMGPVFVGIGSWLFLGEPLRRRTLFGMSLAVFGSVAISGGDWKLSGGHLRGDLLALAGAVFAAGYFMIGRKLRVTRSLGAYVAMVYTVGMMTVLIVVWLADQPLLGYPWVAYRWVVLLGLVSQLIGHTTLNWALRHVSATLVAVITLAEPLGATALAWLFLDEVPGGALMLGACLVLGGIFVVSRVELARGNGQALEPLIDK